MDRVLIPGSNWLYYKIYSGFNSADTFVQEVLPNLIKVLTVNKYIDRWFFIRYTDPEYHLRLRFHLIKKDYIGKVILYLDRVLSKHVNDGFIWKIQIDTYTREIERYSGVMELSEKLFYYDSDCFINIINLLTENNDTNIRWIMAMISIDYLLNDFNLTIVQKKQLMNTLKSNFFKEFSLQKKQMTSKYRTYRDKIESIFYGQERYCEFYNVFIKRSIRSKETVNAIILTKNHNLSELYSLLTSYIHMMMNRWFVTKPRMHEAIIYTFLSMFYESEICRKENNSHDKYFIK